MKYVKYKENEERRKNKMALNISKGNMYGFISHTWNAIKGHCIHDCEYCYMKMWGKLNPIRLDTKELNTDLGKDNFIFVGSSTDMFASDVPTEWINKVLGYCNFHDNNKYLFQSKNPARFIEFIDKFPKNTVLGTTIESNREYKQMGEAPKIRERAEAFTKLKVFDIMVTLEPIMDFDLDELVAIIKKIKPKWVNIGADSKNHNMPEPNSEKVLMLIDELTKFTEIIQKDNIKRIYKKEK